MITTNLSQKTIEAINKIRDWKCPYCEDENLKVRNYGDVLSCSKCTFRTSLYRIRNNDYEDEKFFKREKRRGHDYQLDPWITDKWKKLQCYSNLVKFENEKHPNADYHVVIGFQEYDSPLIPSYKCLKLLNNNINNPLELDYQKLEQIYGFHVYYTPDLDHYKLYWRREFLSRNPCPFTLYLIIKCFLRFRGLTKNPLIICDNINTILNKKLELKK